MTLKQKISHIIDTYSDGGSSLTSRATEEIMKLIVSEIELTTYEAAGIVLATPSVFSESGNHYQATANVIEHRLKQHLQDKFEKYERSN